MNRAELLSLAPEAFAPAPVPVRGGAVLVRALTAVELARSRRLSESDPDSWPLWVGLLGVCDADGAPLLTPADFAAFNRLGTGAHAIATEVMRLSHLDGAGPGND